MQAPSWQTDGPTPFPQAQPPLKTVKETKLKDLSLEVCPDAGGGGTKVEDGLTTKSGVWVGMCMLCQDHLRPVEIQGVIPPKAGSFLVLLAVVRLNLRVVGGTAVEELSRGAGLQANALDLNGYYQRQRFRQHRSPERRHWDRRMDAPLVRAGMAVDAETGSNRTLCPSGCKF